jgi:hypothetical protein
MGNYTHSRRSLPRDCPNKLALLAASDRRRGAEIAAATRVKSMVCLRPVVGAAIPSPALAQDFCAFARDALPLLKWGWEALADAR